MKAMGLILILFAPPSFGQFDSLELVTLANKIKVWQARDTIHASYVKKAETTFSQYEARHANDSLIKLSLTKQVALQEEQKQELRKIIEASKPSWFDDLFNNPTFGFTVGFTVAYLIFR